MRDEERSLLHGGETYCLRGFLDRQGCQTGAAKKWAIAQEIVPSHEQGEAIQLECPITISQVVG